MLYVHVFKYVFLFYDILFSVRNQEEVLLDSEVMNISSKVLKQCTKSLTRLMSSYNHVEFAKKVVKRYYTYYFLSYCS